MSENLREEWHALQARDGADCSLVSGWTIVGEADAGRRVTLC